MKTHSILWISLLLIGLTGCQEDEPASKEYSVTGLVQKGPYINGTTITISELTSSLDQTGNTFSTQITDNTGRFELDNINLTSSYVGLSASGFYFDEVKGNISVAPLNLTAISDLANASTVNVNLLTHLEKPRVEFLVGEGNSYADAKEIAQAEVLAAFGMDVDGIDASEFLDIAYDNQGGAVLLAVSVILQGNRSVGDLSELLATISTDLREDGRLDNAALITSLRSVTKTLNLPAIRNNLQTRYNELGTSSTVPPFETFVEVFLTFTGDAPTVSGLTVKNITAFTADVSVAINPNTLSTAVKIEYGKTSAFGQSIDGTPAVVAGHGNATVNTTLTGLEAGETYYVRVKSENAKGISFTDHQTFKTLGDAAVVTTLDATGVSNTQATLRATVNPKWLETTLVFEYGTDTNYGNTVAPSQPILAGGSDQNVEVSATITGLTEGQAYYFRIKAVNKLGTSLGSPRSITAFLTIGSPYQGGLLAYVLKPGDPGYDPGVVHGLIVAPTDLGSFPWANFLLGPPRGNPDVAIGAGRSNTDVLVALPASPEFSVAAPAARACYDLVIGGFDDWFLPSDNELEALKPNVTVLGLKTGDDDRYWSSSDAPPSCCNFPYSYALTANYSTSLAYAEKDLKGTFRLVRAMRYF